MVYTQADSNSWQTIKELLSFFLGFLPCLMSVQTDLLVPWCDFMKANGWWYSVSLGIFTPLKHMSIQLIFLL